MENEKIIITRKFYNCDREKFFLLPFQVPDNIEKLKISFSTDTRDGVCIDLGLVYPNGEQCGCSGGRTDSIEISAAYSTPGYAPTEPFSGEWKILAGVYRVKTEVTVTYTVELVQKERRWLAGDVHVHTVHSDGGCTPEKVLSIAKKKHFDYLVFTDHNNMRVGELNLTDPDLTVIPGMELTEYRGHCNLIGVKNPVSGGYWAEDYETLKKKIAEAKAKGAMISLNHPCCKLCGWKWPIDEIPFDTVEVWNGPMRNDNISNIELWHKELLKGRRLMAVGGSDYHRDYYVTSLLGLPTTVVYAESNSPADIIRALKNGNSYITCSAKHERLTMEYCGKTLGETAKLDENEKLHVHAENLRAGDYIEVWNNDELIFTAAPHGKSYDVELKVKNAGFVRAQIMFKRSRAGDFIHHQVIGFMLPADKGLKLPPLARCIANPIFIERD